MKNMSSASLVITIGVLLLSAGTIIFKIKYVMRRHKIPPFLLAVVCVVFGLAFRVESIAQPFNTFVKAVPHLSWLVSYCLLVSAIFAGYVTHSAIAGKKTPGYAIVIYLASLSTLTFLFLAGIINEAETMFSSLYPRLSTWTTLFSNAFYIAGILLIYLILRVFAPVYYQEENPVRKARWVAMVVTYNLFIFMFAGKFLLITTGYFFITVITNWVGYLVMYAEIACGIGFAVIQLPSSCYKCIIQPYLLTKKGLTLWNLAYLYRACCQVSGSSQPLALPGGLHLWECIAHPDIYIRQLLTAVLDFKVSFMGSGLPSESQNNDDNWLQLQFIHLALCQLFCSKFSQKCSQNCQISEIFR